MDFTALTVISMEWIRPENGVMEIGQTCRECKNTLSPDKDVQPENNHPKEYRRRGNTSIALAARLFLRGNACYARLTNFSVAFFKETLTRLDLTPHAKEVVVHP